MEITTELIERDAAARRLAKDMSGDLWTCAWQVANSDKVDAFAAAVDSLRQGIVPTRDINTLDLLMAHRRVTLQLDELLPEQDRREQVVNAAAGVIIALCGTRELEADRMAEYMVRHNEAQLFEENRLPCQPYRDCIAYGMPVGNRPACAEQPEDCHSQCHAKQLAQSQVLDGYRIGCDTGIRMAVDYVIRPLLDDNPELVATLNQLEREVQTNAGLDLGDRKSGYWHTGFDAGMRAAQAAQQRGDPMPAPHCEGERYYPDA